MSVKSREKKGKSVSAQGLANAHAPPGTPQQRGTSKIGLEKVRQTDRTRSAKVTRRDTSARIRSGREGRPGMKRNDDRPRWAVDLRERTYVG